MCIRDREYSAGINFSARNFPALSTRTPRRKLREVGNLNGMYHLNGLLTVCGKDLIYTPDEAGAAAVTLENAVADSKKTLVGIGTKILIFPDKAAFDTAERTLQPPFALLLMVKFLLSISDVLAESCQDRTRL